MSRADTSPGALAPGSRKFDELPCLSMLDYLPAYVNVLFANYGSTYLSAPIFTD